MPLALFFGQMSASFSTSARGLALARSTTYGRHSTSTRTSVVPVARSLPPRADMGRHCLTPSVRRPCSPVNFCLNCRTSGCAKLRIQDVQHTGKTLARQPVTATSLLSDYLGCLRESVFGYITVLPSTFSAYRYIALQNDARGEGPLQKYFLGETMVRRLILCHFFAPNHFHSTGRA